MHITSDHLDTIQELLNIGVGRAAGSLNQMLGKPIRLHIPLIRFGNKEELFNELPKNVDLPLSSVQLPFKGKFSGSACLLFPTDSAGALVSALTGETEDTDILHSLKEATLTEIGNIVLNGVMGSLANIFQHKLRYSIPFYQETSVQHLLKPESYDSSETALWAKTQFTIEEYDISGDIMLLFGPGEIELLVYAVEELTRSPSSLYAPN